MSAGLVDYASSESSDDSEPEVRAPPPRSATRTQLGPIASYSGDDSDSDSGSENDGSSPAPAARPSLFGSLPAPKRGEKPQKKDKDSKRDKQDKKKKQKKQKQKQQRKPKLPGSGDLKRRRPCGSSDLESEGEEVVDGVLRVEGLGESQGPAGKRLRYTGREDDLSQMATAEPGLVLDHQDQGPALPPEFHPSDIYAVQPQHPQHPMQQRQQQQQSQAAHEAGPHPLLVGVLPPEMLQQGIDGGGGGRRLAKEFQDFLSGEAQLVTVDQNQQLRLSEADLAMIREEQELLEKHRQLNPGASAVDAASAGAPKASRIAKSKHQISTLVSHARGVEMDLLRHRQHRDKMRAITKSRYGF